MYEQIEKLHYCKKCGMVCRNTDDYCKKCMVDELYEHIQKLERGMK